MKFILCVTIYCNKNDVNKTFWKIQRITFFFFICRGSSQIRKYKQNKKIEVIAFIPRHLNFTNDLEFMWKKTTLCGKMARCTISSAWKTVF